MDIIISRVCFCTRCKEAQRPHADDWVMLYGFTHQRFFFKQPDHHIGGKLLGYTPHIFINKGFYSQKSGIMKVVSFCGVIGCGVDILEYADNGEAKWQAINSTTIYMPHHEWSHLFNFRDTGYEL